MVKQVEINNYTTLAHDKNFIRLPYNIELTVGLIFGVNVFNFNCNYKVN